MSKFPAQFIDMAVERDLFDHTGAQPPSVRLSVELPPEYLDKPETGATPPYSDDRVDKQVLADIQTSVMREYGGAARRLLNAFRQDVGLGDLSVNGRRAMLGEGVGMSYVSQFGNESIRIHVSQQGVRYLLSEQNILMLVLYGDNKIAYVPMSSIASPAGKVSKKTLAQSSWVTPPWWDAGASAAAAGSFYIVAAQLKFSTEIHAVEAAFSVSSGGVVSIPANETQFYVFNSKQTLLSNAASSIVNEPYPKAQYPYPVINRNGNYIYNERGDKFLISGASISRVADGSVYIDSFNRTFGFRNVMAVTQNGERHTGALVWATAIGTSDGIIDGEPVSLSQDTAYHNFLTSISPTPNLFFINFGPNPATIDTVSGDSGGSISTYNQIYSKSNKFDVLTITSGTANATFEFFGVGPFPTNRRMSGSLFGYNFNSVIDTDTIVSQREGIYRHGFPYALEASYGKMYVSKFINDDVSAPFFSTQFFTPYGDFGPYVSDDTPYAPDMFGWLHIANGTNVLQAFVINDGNACTKRMYLNNIDYGSTLASAIGCSLDDIRLILFDIKKADIDKLK